MDDNQLSLIAPPSMYDRLKEMGKDMSWLDKLRAKRTTLRKSDQAPLANTICGNLSIYLLKTDGTLWTIHYSGRPYMHVRTTNNKPAADTFICVCCTTTFKELEEARRHYEH